MKQKQKSGTKLLSVLLTLVMVVGLLPSMSVTVLADEPETSTYTLTIPSTLSVANSGWNATDGISATGSLASGKKLTVTASSDGEFALVNQSDNTQKVGYKLATASTDTEATTSWEFTDLSSTAATKPMGIIVDDYSSKPAGTYTDTVTFTAKVEDAVKVETLLTTLTFGGSSTYSETTSGVVSVTATNVTDYNAKFGWLWFEEGSLSVTAKEGYTITKCVFIQNAKTPITDTEAPFEIHSSRGNITEDTTWSMDGVTSIEVYGYAN